MSFFGNIGRRIIDAREKQARRYVNGALLSMDEQILKNAGFDREKLRRNAQQSVF